MALMSAGVTCRTGGRISAFTSALMLSEAVSAPLSVGIGTSRRLGEDPLTRGAEEVWATATGGWH